MHGNFNNQKKFNSSTSIETIQSYSEKHLIFHFETLNDLDRKYVFETLMKSEVDKKTLFKIYKKYQPEVHISELFILLDIGFKLNEIKETSHIVHKLYDEILEKNLLNKIHEAEELRKKKFNNDLDLMFASLTIFFTNNYIQEGYELLKTIIKGISLEPRKLKKTFGLNSYKKLLSKIIETNSMKSEKLYLLNLLNIEDLKTVEKKELIILLINNEDLLELEIEKSLQVEQIIDLIYPSRKPLPITSYKDDKSNNSEVLEILELRLDDKRISEEDRKQLIEKYASDSEDEIDEAQYIQRIKLDHFEESDVPSLLYTFFTFGFYQFCNELVKEFENDEYKLILANLYLNSGKDIESKMLALDIIDNSKDEDLISLARKVIILSE